MWISNPDTHFHVKLPADMWFYVFAFNRTICSLESPSKSWSDVTVVARYCGQSSYQHTTIPCQLAYTLWPMSVDAVAWGPSWWGGLMARLSYHLGAAAWGGRGPHNKVICPSLALESPLDACQPGPLSGPSDCHASAASPRRPGRVDCWGGGMGWRHGATGRRDDPTGKAFV